MENSIQIKNCPGTLSKGYDSYNRTCYRKMFFGRKVSPILPYYSPSFSEENNALFLKNISQISIPGNHEKFSFILHKNKLKLTEENEGGNYILKPISTNYKNNDQRPANEHLTMQIASQIYGIETAENSLVFFKNGEPGYLTKRFDFIETDNYLAVEDFASLANRTSKTHGNNFKFDGNYYELFQIIKKYLPAYRIEIPKLFTQILFNFLFSNGNAHYKNFSIIETSFCDFKLSPAYNLLNTKMHLEDDTFALTEGLLPTEFETDSIINQFDKLAELIGISNKQKEKIYRNMFTKSHHILKLVSHSFLNDNMKRSYLKMYQERLKLIKMA